MQGDLIVIFGGSGFVGRYVVRALAKAGKRVRVAMRRPHLGHELPVMGDVGQIQLVQANVRNEDSINRALEGATGVVNLVGLLFEKGTQNFGAVQAGGAASVARLAAQRGITRFVQVSAIGTDAASRSAYAQTKAAAEAAVRAAMPSATILRPSIIFGPEDGFFNRFAAMARVTPALPLIGGGHTRFQPVYVGDVAQAVVAGLEQSGAQGRTFELGGPSVYSFKALLQYITKEIARPRFLAPLPFWMAQPMGNVLDAVLKVLPIAPPLTGDQVELLRTDNVVGLTGDPAIGTLADLGITTLETVEAIVPTYLWRYRPHGQFQARTKGA